MLYFGFVWVLCDVGLLGVLLVRKDGCWLELLNCLNLWGVLVITFGWYFAFGFTCCF